MLSLWICKRLQADAQVVCNQEASRQMLILWICKCLQADAQVMCNQEASRQMLSSFLSRGLQTDVQIICVYEASKQMLSFSVSMGLLGSCSAHMFEASSQTLISCVSGSQAVAQLACIYEAARQQLHDSSVGKESTCNAGDLGWKDPLEKGKTTHSSVLAQRSPWTVQFMGLQRVGHD